MFFLRFEDCRNWGKNGGDGLVALDMEQDFVKLGRVVKIISVASFYVKNKFCLA